MFESSEANGWLIEQLARALPHPLATSLTDDIYALMPNDTDLTIYKSRGMPGLNFAFIGGLGYYHTPDDTPANLDLRTLQHQGENLLAMTRHLGRLDLDQVRSKNVVYFSVLERFMMIYPVSWAMPLLLSAVLAYLMVTTLGLTTRRIRIVEVIVGTAVFPLAALAAVLVVGILWLGALRIIRAWELSFFRFDGAILSAFSVVALVVAALVFAPASRRWSMEGLGLGLLGWWLALAAVTSIWLPGASYAFFWPLLAILLGLAVSFALPQGAAAALLAAWLGATPLLILHMTILPGILNALNLTMAPLLMIPVLLVAGALVPLAAQSWPRPS